MVDLNGHEAGNGGYSQGKPTVHRASSTRSATALSRQTQHLLRSMHSLTKYYSVTEAHGEVLSDVENALNQAIERLQNMDVTRPNRDSCVIA